MVKQIIEIDGVKRELNERELELITINGPHRSDVFFFKNSLGTIETKSDIDELIIRESEVDGVGIADANIECLYIEQNSKLKRLILKNSKVKNLKIEGSSVELLEIHNDDSCPIETLTVSNSECGNFKSICTSINLIQLINSHFSKFWHKSTSKFCNLEIEQGLIVDSGFKFESNSSHKISLKDSIDGRLDISFGDADNLELSKLFLTNELSLTAKQGVSKFSVNGFSCGSGKLSIHDFRALVGQSKTSVLFKSISFGESDFKDCDFCSFAHFEIDKVQFQSASSTGTRWPLNPVYKSGNSLLRSYCFKVYKMLVDDGDLEQGLQFRRSYLNTKVSLLKSEESESKLVAWADRVSLQLGEFTSEHGTNWLRALVILLCFNLVLTPILVNFFILEKSFESAVFYCSHFKDSFNYYWLNLVPIDGKVFSMSDALLSMNPAHRLKSLSFEGGTWFVLYNTISRAINGYLYFQIVKSFRKYIV
ncbi:hypothetical protein GSF04_22870 [Pseudoalteromonas sp. A22]|uniref:hypothetical protein n=1 Tax=Pseudoalteromonas sp. A22 TaxID=327511 RepID=UPI001BA95851|nr:hypothetical protein [Pseudoalteromonas sp. A22]QUI65163.1 hypothetical protein GSF04_22870 [Pseudoalteromonas sp. A22]